MILALVLLLFSLFVGLGYFLNRATSPKRDDIAGEHVIVTGGSSGIGKAVAIELASRGASLTLIARDMTKLQDAKEDVEEHFRDPDKQTVNILSLDLTSDYETIRHGFETAESALGAVYMLVNSAGLATNARFHETAIGDFKQSMDINFLGTTYATRAVISGMMARNRGRIVFVSSVAGQVGIYGYTAYSASKFALRGLAEALQMELQTYNIHVTLSFPPDTDTPGFQEELKTKPQETAQISKTAGLFEAKDVAKRIIDDALRGKFLTYLGLDGWMVTHLTAGMSPPSSVPEVMLQGMCMGLLRIVSILYLTYFERIVKKCKKEREEKGGGMKKREKRK